MKLYEVVQLSRADARALRRAGLSHKYARHLDVAEISPLLSDLRGWQADRSPRRWWQWKRAPSDHAFVEAAAVLTRAESLWVAYNQEGQKRQDRVYKLGFDDAFKMGDLAKLAHVDCSPKGCGHFIPPSDRHGWDRTLARLEKEERLKTLEARKMALEELLKGSGPVPYVAATLAAFAAAYLSRR